MIHAYDESYLSDAMYGLGSMLDFAVNSCGESPALFYARFLRSGVADQMEKGNPRYLCGLSGVELAQTVAARTGRPLGPADALIDMGSPEFWTGWTLAYLQWALGVSFKALAKADVGPEALLARYQALHEADLSKAMAFAQKALAKHRQAENPLRTQRLNAGLTQASLAALSGLSLRAIRAYEQSQLSLSNAGAESVLRLARVIGCEAEELVG